MQESTARAARAGGVLRHAAGITELVAHLGDEITRVVQETHAALDPAARIGTDAITRPVYRAIRLGFGSAGLLGRLGGSLLAGESRPDALLDVQSALNGVFGDRLDAAESAFALPMKLVGPAAVTTDAPEPPRTLVFLHGLCMNERGWRSLEHARFRRWARRRLGAGSRYLRYNTGLRISENGARLATLLEQSGPSGELVLVGHSMGGLVARSALHHGLAAGHAWPWRVRRLACLGSPHQGARLERLGNHANRMLATLPFTRPFQRLGDLRSDGIRDLRFGHLLASDWRGRPADAVERRHSPVEPAPHVAHLYVAGRIQARRTSFGDGLVSVSSALALHLHAAASVRRECLDGMGHVRLLSDARVYALLRDWLTEAPAQAPGDDAVATDTRRRSEPLRRLEARRASTPSGNGNSER